MNCACSSKMTLEDCCLPIINGERMAKVPEELMRARYTAFTLNRMDFIESSHDPKTRDDLDMKATREWAKENEWLGLEILDAEEVSLRDTDGEVEFVATFRNKNGKDEHHEISTFKKRKGIWYFSEGAEQGHESVVRESPKVGRNDPCLCGSGKKYKKCCASHAEINA